MFCLFICWSQYGWFWGFSNWVGFMEFFLKDWSVWSWGLRIWGKQSCAIYFQVLFCLFISWSWYSWDSPKRIEMFKIEVWEFGVSNLLLFTFTFYRLFIYLFMLSWYSWLWNFPSQLEFTYLDTLDNSVCELGPCYISFQHYISPILITTIKWLHCDY